MSDYELAVLSFLFVLISILFYLHYLVKKKDIEIEMLKTNNQYLKNRVDELKENYKNTLEKIKEYYELRSKIPK